MIKNRLAWAVTLAVTIGLMLAALGSPASAAPNCDDPKPPPICSEDEPPEPPGTPYGTISSFGQYQTDVSMYGTAREPNGGPVWVEIAVDGVVKRTVQPGKDGWYGGTVPARPLANVCATVRNSVGTRTALGCREVHGPIGHLDVFYQNNTTVMTGWVIDPDTSGPVTLNYPYNAGYVANQPRSDVAALYPGYGPNHGFTIVFNGVAGSMNLIAKNIGLGVEDTYLDIWIG